MQSMIRIGMVLVCALVPAALAAEPSEPAPATQPAQPDAVHGAELRAYDAELAKAYAAEARQERDDTLARLQQLRDAIRNVTGRTDVSADGLRKLVQTLEEQREALELDEAGRSAKRALEDALKAAAVGAANSADGDAAIKELQAVVDAREAQLNRLAKLAATGAVTQSEKEAAQADLAQARANLALRQREAALDHGGGEMAALNHDLVNLTVAEAERLARLEFIKRRLDKLRDATPLLDDLDGLQGRLQRDQNAADVASEKARLAYWEAAHVYKQPAHAVTTAPQP